MFMKLYWKILFIQLNINDKQLIEKALDHLLDVALDKTVLELFKSLCRHYYFINAETTVFYVNSYREMWDENSFDTKRGTITQSGNFQTFTEVR